MNSDWIGGVAVGWCLVGVVLYGGVVGGGVLQRGSFLLTELSTDYATHTASASRFSTLFLA